MKVGSFKVDLDNPPHGLVRRNLAGFKSLVVTPLHLTDRTLARADLLSQARYRGVVAGWDNQRTTVYGTGMLGYLGDGGGYGAGLRESSYTARTFEQWWDRYESTHARTNGLTKGTTYSMPAGTWPNDATSFLPYSVRGAFEFLASSLGVEYVVNPDGTVDMGATGSSLFRTTPTVILSPWSTGTSGELRSFPVPQWRVGKDYEDYLNFVRTELSNTPATYGSDSNYGSEAFKDAAGSTAIFRGTVETQPIGGTTDGDAYSSGFLSQHDEVRVNLSVSVDVHDPGHWMQPGDQLYAWDPRDVLLDTSNPIQFKGEITYPIKLRLRGMDQPCRRGYGYYLMSDDASDDPAYIDLTPWVKFEDGPTRLEVGAPWRGAFDGIAGVNV